MEFLIDFNRKGNDKHLVEIGGKAVHENGEFIGYFVTIDTLEDIGTLEKKVKEATGEYYALIISVSELDGNTIYLDLDI